MANQHLFRRHADLVDRMADRLGVDLEEAVLRGQMELDELSDAVVRCSGCQNPDNCEYILDNSIGTGTPAYCRNTALFTKLENSR